MSVLSFPRLYFQGTASWDPIVSNNVPAVYDGTTAQAVLAPGETVDDFRRRLISTTVERGDWNYFGTHRCLLEHARVTGGCSEPRAAATQADDQHDPLVGASVELAGKLVDIDPAGACSQIFFDELTIGFPGNAHIRARPRRRMSSRWLNFGRNLTRLPIAGSAAAVWQTVFPTADVDIIRAAGSPILSKFAEALHDGSASGLTVRLATYRTQYFQNGILNSLEPAATLEALQVLHEQGKPVSNPAYSLVVGSVGLWFDGDSESVPGGRNLFAQSPAPVLNAGGRPATAGPAAAEFDSATKLLSFDFSNTIPELDANVEKADFGPIDVVVTKDGSATTIARIEPSAYDRSAYETRGGIVDVDVSGQPDIGSLLADSTLSLRVGNPDETGEATVLLAERELTALCADCNVYLDEGEDRKLVIQARRRGEIPIEPLSVLVAWYDQADAIVFSGETTVLPVAADGTAELVVSAQQPGYRHLRFAAFTGAVAPAPPVQLSIATAQFTSLRTLPFDDALEAATPDQALTWDFIYSTILQTYDAIAPRMSNIIDLGNADAVRTFARTIRRLTAAELFESIAYMPVTRDLSRGKRRLLHRFCDLLLGALSTRELVTAAPPAAAPTGAPPAPVPAEGQRVVVPRVADRLPGVPAGASFDKRARS